jgi:uncharacterized membrane protein YeiH
MRDSSNFQKRNLCHYLYSGRIVFFILRKFNLDNDILYLISSLVIIIVRLMAVKFKWYLPTLEN